MYYVFWGNQCFYLSQEFSKCVFYIFSSIVLIDRVHFQICWLTRIHSTRIIKIDWLRIKVIKVGRESKVSEWRKELSRVRWRGYGSDADRLQIYSAICRMRREKLRFIYSLNIFWLVFMCQTKVLGVKVTKLPWSLQNIHILWDCISFLLLS